MKGYRFFRDDALIEIYQEFTRCRDCGRYFWPDDPAGPGPIRIDQCQSCQKKQYFNIVKERDREEKKEILLDSLWRDNYNKFISMENTQRILDDVKDRLIFKQTQTTTGGKADEKVWIKSR